jgi:hypothetical protein
VQLLVEAFPPMRCKLNIVGTSGSQQAVGGQEDGRHREPHGESCERQKTNLKSRRAKERCAVPALSRDPVRDYANSSKRRHLEL